MKKSYVTILFILMSFATTIAQNDSLLTVFLSSSQSDSSRVQAALKLCMDYSSNVPDSCILMADKAIALSKKAGYIKKLPALYKLKGVALVNKSDYKESLKIYLLALKEAEKQNNIKEIGAINSNIGVNFWYQKDFKTALKYHLTSLEYRLKLGDAKDISKSYNNLGIVAVDMGQYGEALKYYNAALHIKDSLGDLVGVANANNNIGIVYENLKNYKEAKKYYEKALSIFREQDDKRGIVVGLNNLAIVYKNMEDHVSAIDHATKALELAKEIKDAEDVKNAHEILAVCYHKKGNYKDAYDHLFQFNALSDSLKNENIAHEIADMEKKYQTEKQEQEIKLLSRDNRIKDMEIKDYRTNRMYLLVIICLAIIVIILAAYAVNKIRKQKRFLELNKISIEQKNVILEYQKKEIIDSINYARRIQYSLLANEQFIAGNFKDHFILFKPKDIVSGDFYWAATSGPRFYLAVCDCTGHGVPGAFMSLLSIGFLSEAIKEKNIAEPNKIFDYVRERLMENVSRDEQKDGFDGILMCFDRSTNKISYAAANNAPLMVQNGVAQQLQCDKMPVGLGERKQPFELFELYPVSGTQLYLYTDGYADQFGGPKGKKFKYKQLISLIHSQSEKPMKEQRQILNNSIEEWRGKLEQIDDICVIGIRL